MKKVLFLLVLLVFSSVAFAALTDQYVTPFNAPRRYGVERVTHFDPRVLPFMTRIDAFVYLSPAVETKGVGVGRGGYSPIYPRGTAMVRSSSYLSDPRSKVFIKTKDLEPTDRIKAKYEAWLVDDDSGYRLSLGTFTTAFGGIGILDYQSHALLNAYDRIEVTLEPLYDDDLRPGPAVLVADFPKPNKFFPEPKQAKLLTKPFKKY